MFNRSRIKVLEAKVQSLSSRLDDYESRYWNLHQSYYMLLEKLGLKEQRLPASVTLTNREGR